MSNYDDWKTAVPPYLDGDDSIADAECAAMDANKRWLRDNLNAITYLYESWASAIADAFESHAGRAPDEDDDLPLNGIQELYEDAKNEDKHYEFVKRQGRHLGLL